MLEKRKLKVVCFKATLTKNEKTVRLDIHRQLVREIRGGYAHSLENERVYMIAVPELLYGSMFLLGRNREIPETEKQFSEQHTTEYWGIQKENLAYAGRWIKQLMEKGYYGYGKQYR